MGEAKVLVVIPAYNEERTIAAVLHELRTAAPAYDRLVVNDGSRDNTGRIVDEMGERHLRLPCNLGYGHALQAGLKYGLLRGYEVMVSFDADGQHRAEDVRPLVRALLDSDAGMVIGSRFIDGRPYAGPAGRTLGQRLFSHLTRLLTGRRIYDTTSGFKAMRASVCSIIVSDIFMDLHTETIVRLSGLGIKIVEHPITVHERKHGQSLHTTISFIAYPLQTLLLTLVVTVDALLARRTK